MCVFLSCFERPVGYSLISLCIGIQILVILCFIMGASLHYVRTIIGLAPFLIITALWYGMVRSDQSRNAHEVTENLQDEADTDEGHPPDPHP